MSHSAHLPRRSAAHPAACLRVSRVVLLAVSLLATGCQSEIPQTEPEGGYLAFRQALLDGSSEALWGTLAEETKQLFRDAFADLQVLAESINHLPPNDRMLANERTAVFLLDVADSPESLFAALVRLETIRGQDAYIVGSEVDHVNLDPAGDRAAITTRTGQVIDVIREEDGIWRVRSLTSLIHERLRPLQDNVMAVEIMVAESGHMRRNHDEIMQLLGGTITDGNTADGESAEGTGTPSAGTP